MPKQNINCYHMLVTTTTIRNSSLQLKQASKNLRMRTSNTTKDSVKCRDRQIKEPKRNIHEKRLFSKSWNFMKKTLRMDSLYHVCSYYSKLFTLKSDTIRHKRLHTGVKPFKCEVCDKTLNQKFSMKSHMLTHTGVKSFKCNVNDIYNRLQI